MKPLQQPPSENHPSGAVNEAGEAELVELLAQIFGAGPLGPNQLGIGDDAAVMPAPRAPIVWSIDAEVEGVHFQRSWLSLEQLGFKSTMAAASDLAAMAAQPLGVLSALIVPEGFSADELTALATGQAAASQQLGTKIYGGNLARGEQLSITTTVLGTAQRPTVRSGAKPGDRLWVTGPLGLAAAGLQLLQSSPQPPGTAECELALAAWRQPQARLAAGQRAAAIATAGIDISDGLALDIARLAKASGGEHGSVRVVLDREALPTPELLRLAEHLGCSASELALHGGEDYALAVTTAPGRSLEGFRQIGTCEARNPDAPAVVVRSADGAVQPVAPRGFDHFARD